jgi:hypothetical protein
MDKRLNYNRLICTRHSNRNRQTTKHADSALGPPQHRVRLLAQHPLVGLPTANEHTDLRMIMYLRNVLNSAWAGSWWLSTAHR